MKKSTTAMVSKGVGRAGRKADRRSTAPAPPVGRERPPTTSRASSEPISVDALVEVFARAGHAYFVKHYASTNKNFDEYRKGEKFSRQLRYVRRYLVRHFAGRIAPTKRIAQRAIGIGAAAKRVRSAAKDGTRAKPGPKASPKTKSKN